MFIDKSDDSTDQGYSLFVEMGTPQGLSHNLVKIFKSDEHNST